MAKRKSTIPTYKRRRPRGSLIGRIVGWIIKIVIIVAAITGIVIFGVEVWRMMRH